MNISIKGVSEEDWRTIKSEAVKRNMKMGEFINKMILVYKKNERKNGNWNSIIHGKKFLTNEVTKKIKNVMKDFRREYEFR